MTQPFSHRTYQGTGEEQLLAVPFPFVVRQHVRVFVGWTLSDGEREAELLPDIGFEWINDGSIRTITPVAAGKTVSVVRLTPIEQQVVQWQPGSPPTAAELNSADRQILFVVQEWLDRVVGLQGDIGVIIDAGLSVSVIDNLDSSSPTAALSARQGKILKEMQVVLAGAIDDIQDVVDDLAQGGGGGGGGAPVEIVDNLESESTSSALSANQGRLLGLSISDAKLALSARNSRITATAEVTAGVNDFATGVIALHPCAIIQSIALSRAGSLALYADSEGMAADQDRNFISEEPGDDAKMITQIRLASPGEVDLPVKMIAMSSDETSDYPFRVFNEGASGLIDVSISFLPIQLS